MIFTSTTQRRLAVLAVALSAVGLSYAQTAGQGGPNTVPLSGSPTPRETPPPATVPRDTLSPDTQGSSTSSSDLARPRVDSTATNSGSAAVAPQGSASPDTLQDPNATSQRVQPYSSRRTARADRG